MIRIPRLAHLGVFLLLFSVAFPFFGAPEVLWVLFAIPLALVVWVERTRTTVSDKGIDTQTMFKTRHIDWSQVKGLQIPKRGYLKLHLTDETDATLPAVGFDRLGELVVASNGRIPDPFVEPEEEDADAGEEESQE
ncbi:PH domain-containing protein [Nocardia sp. 2]|uniref:PH domain-containing protein n=1 Tax=Nocardia acididurans TaxID=2802282 RepID=A0ABS1MGF3_9NOCA|nr:PH domain-containing protein [Nocardia acididurans]